MSTTINGTSGVTFPDGSTQATAATSGLVNKIINGRMEIDQRNAGASVAVTTAGQYTLDRWAVASPTAFGGQLTAQRSTTAPSGFTNSLALTVTTADASIGATDYYAAIQRIEGYNVADLGWGASGASTVTLSFWVRASVTGTYSGSLRNNASDRSYVFEYSVSAANTWEQKAITIVGDTSGTWLKDNGTGIDIWWSVGAGSTYKSSTVGSWQSGTYLASNNQTQLISTLNATFYITGVDLRKGTVAPSTYNMDWRPYGLELALCQRYCYAQVSNGAAYYSFGISSGNGTTPVAFIKYPVTMRVAPSLSSVSSGSSFLFASGSGTTISQDQVSPDSGWVFASGTVVSATGGYSGRFLANNTTPAYMIWSAEL